MGGEKKVFGLFKDKYRVDYLSFFQGEDEPPCKEDRVYQNQFLQEDTRYVYWEVNLSYPLLHEPKQISLKVITYNPDGTVFGVDELDEELEEDTNSYWFSSGIGYDDLGLWYPGEYRVECFVNEKILIEDKFVILAEESFLNSVSADPLLLFAGTFDDEPSKENRVYKTEYSRIDTSYIFWEVNLSYPLLETKKWVKFQYVFYSPDGSILDQEIYRIELESGSGSSTHSMGIGFDRPGDWEFGIHRVVIFLNGRHIAEGTFEILKDNMFIFPVMAVESMVFFEGGVKSPPKEERVYQTIFSKETSRFINWEVDLSFSTIQKRKQIKLEHEYLMEDGTSLGKGQVSFNLEKGWNSACINLGKGSIDPGLWQPGRYQVQIKIDGKLMANEWFEVE